MPFAHREPAFDSFSRNHEGLIRETARRSLFLGAKISRSHFKNYDCRVFSTGWGVPRADDSAAGVSGRDGRCGRRWKSLGFARRTGVEAARSSSRTRRFEPAVFLKDVRGVRGAWWPAKDDKRALWRLASRSTHFARLRRSAVE